MNNIEIDYKKPCIYMLKHKESGKFYVGSASRGLRKRLSVHKCPSNGCIKLASAIKKYGFDSFEISILEYCNIETIIQREQYYLDVLQPFDSNGYNIAKFAACPQKGRKLTEDHKQKISNSNTGKKHINRKRRPPQTNETKLKISNANKGKNRSKKQKEKCRLNRLGKTDSIESRIKKSVAQTGRKHTDESKKKMSLVQLGRKHSKESIEKMRLAKLGRNKNKNRNCQ